MICSVKPNWMTEDLKTNIEQAAIALKLKNSNSRPIVVNFTSFSASTPKIMHNPPDSNCAYESWTEQPFIVKNDNHIKAVVQTEFFKQHINMVQCATSRTSPSSDPLQCFSNVLAADGSRCVTKNTDITLLTYNVKTGKVDWTPVRIPVCCTCVIEPS
ncbi:uncharacterized protein LOC114245239 [Bombyx mandarina]|uniref:Uncharacterized protein LOC114245239 n=1 Tax=Bombyx mandarina TaxID=7092 RepID=A0A6J2JU53_BOMMA|nr:uncharacterized protein LOC114245239 [Bombyx mandarina]